MKNAELSLKKGVFVKIIAGKDKGTIGEIVRVIKSKELLLVKGVNLKKKHIKPKVVGTGTILWIEGPIHRSNVAICNACSFT